MPKIHYIDPGVRRAILQKRGDVDGAEFEGAIVTEAIKQSKTGNLPLQFFHIRTADGREIDLLLEREDGYIAIECKQSDNIKKKDTKHFIGLEDILDKPLLLSLVVSNDNSVRQLVEDQAIWNVPAPLLFS